MRSQMADEVERAMAPLTDREKEVMRLRYGLGTDREHTLEEVGRRLSITRERARRSKPRPCRRCARPRTAPRKFSLLDGPERLDLLLDGLAVANDHDRRLVIAEVFLRHLTHLLRRDGIHLLHVGVRVCGGQSVQIHILQLGGDAAAARVL